MMTPNGVIPKICLNWTNIFFFNHKKMLFLDVFPPKISKKYFFQSLLKNSWDKGLNLFPLLCQIEGEEGEGGSGGAVKLQILGINLLNSFNFR